MTIRMENQLNSMEKRIKQEAQLNTDVKTHTQQYPLRYWVERALDKYLTALKGTEVTKVYDLVIKEVEIGLLKTVMRHANGNQSKAAQLLGVARGTLRSRLIEYGLLEKNSQE